MVMLILCSNLVKKSNLIDGFQYDLMTIRVVRGGQNTHI